MIVPAAPLAPFIGPFSGLWYCPLSLEALILYGFDDAPPPPPPVFA